MTNDLKVGGHTPDAIYLGATNVDAVYLGADKVWPSAPTGPSLALPFTGQWTHDSPGSTPPAGHMVHGYGRWYFAAETADGINTAPDGNPVSSPLFHAQQLVVNGVTFTVTRASTNNHIHPPGYQFDVTPKVDATNSPPVGSTVTVQWLP